MEACVAAARATPTGVINDQPVDGVEAVSNGLVRNIALSCLLLPSLQLKVPSVVFLVLLARFYLQ